MKNFEEEEEEEEEEQEEKEVEEEDPPEGSTWGLVSIGTKNTRKSAPLVIPFRGCHSLLLAYNDSNNLPQLAGSLIFIQTAQWST